MKYKISYEIERYEVRLILKNGKEISGNICFYGEEEAVCFALTYEQEHPGRKAKIHRVEKAIVEEA